MKTWLTGFYQTKDTYWDFAGVFFGGIGFIALFGQLLSELERQGPTNLSFTFLIGYVLVFGFWLMYGLRFQRMAIIVTNVLCLLLQILILLTAILR